MSRMFASKHRGWRIAKRVVPLVFLALVLALIVWRARAIDWPAVVQALRDYRATTLLAAGGLAMLSYLIYSCYDLVGRAYTRHRLSAGRSMLIAAISYAFNLNFGTLVGGMGFRYRLYTHAGLRPGLITRVLAVSVVGNWIGWFCVAGIAFALGWVPLGENWKVSAGGVRVIGIVLLLLAAVYLGLCAFSPRRGFTIRGFEMTLPSARLASVQVGLAVFNWLLMSAIVFVLLRPHVPFHYAQGVLMASAVASVIVRVPAGLGVIEAVFIALLADRVGEPRLVAALLAYRAIYYFAPLLVAIGVYAVIEGRGRVRVARGRANPQGLSSR
jgi:glycosyltransferase 2 family protein